MANKVYWVDGRPVVLGRKGRFVMFLITALVMLVFISVAAVAPLAISLGIGYALSSFTAMPLPTAIALALGSILVTVLFSAGRGIEDALKSIRDRMTYLDEGDDDDEDEDEDEDEEPDES